MRSLRLLVLVIAGIGIGARLQANTQGSFFGYQYRSGLAFDSTGNSLYISLSIGIVQWVRMGPTGPNPYWFWQPLDVSLNNLDVSPNGSSVVVAQNNPDGLPKASFTNSIPEATRSPRSLIPAHPGKVALGM